MSTVSSKAKHVLLYCISSDIIVFNCQGQPSSRTNLQRSNSSVSNFLSKTRQLSGSLRGSRSNKSTVMDAMDHDAQEEKLKPKNNSEYFKRYELMIEL